MPSCSASRVISRCLCGAPRRQHARRDPVDRRGASAGGSTAAITSPMISKAWLAGVYSPPNRHTAPDTTTTITRLAMMVR